jgi:hypothetical protein
VGGEGASARFSSGVMVELYCWWAGMSRARSAASRHQPVRAMSIGWRRGETRIVAQSLMNTRIVRSSLAAAVVVLVLAGCNRQTRGNADANQQSRAATPREGGATSTAGSAGDPKNFGDTRAKTQEDGQSPSASPTGWSKDAKPGDTGGATNAASNPATARKK